MICCFHTRGHAYTFEKARKSPLAPKLKLMCYDQLFRACSLPSATYVFSDLERLGHWDLELAAQAYLTLREAGLAVHNNPALHKNRLTLLRQLHAAGLNDFNAWPVSELSAVQRFPVFVRKIQDHRAPLSDLLNNPAELKTAVTRAVSQGVPESNLIIIEFAGEPFRPGLYRKFSSFRVGSQIVPHVTVHDRVWSVKYGFMFQDIEDIYRDEHQALVQNQFSDHVMKAFQIAGIEYGRADFGLYRGRLQIYEINTNPHLAPGGEHPSAVRAATERLAWEKFHAALHQLDSPSGRSVCLANDRAKKLRALKNHLFRTRKVP